jgi:cold shock CspA family protein
MGRSTETFNKKEKEKKRLKKQQDKKEKAEERKANSSKGKGLDEMMAYVDADGNITDVPPDPAKRKEIALEAIAIGVPKQEAIPDDGKRKGIVTMFNEQKGFGFIRDEASNESIFVHVSGLNGPVRENDRVTFETTQGQKGLAAIKVSKV